MTDNACKFRGESTSCCQPVFACDCQAVPAAACTPTVESFAAILSGNPGIDAGAVGQQLHVCSECPHRWEPQAAAPVVSRGLGDTVAKGLAAVGITKERVQAVVGEDCGCPERQEDWNQRVNYGKAKP